MPNAMDLLKVDHAHVKALFQQDDAAGHRAYQKKRGIAEEVFIEPGQKSSPSILGRACATNAS